MISIITVLASMFLPALSRAKDKAESVHCSSQLRQIGVSVFMYTDDWDSAMPAWGGHEKRFFGFGNYFMALKDNYIDNRKIFRCPSDDGVRKFDGADCYMETSNGVNGSSYAMPANWNIFVVSRIWTSRFERRLISRFNRTETLMMVSDTGTLSPHTGAYKAGMDLCPGAEGWYYTNAVTDRHLGSNNMVMFDGHVMNETFSKIQQVGKRNWHTSGWTYWLNDGDCQD